MRYAVITPSYEPDFERCRLLVDSMDQLVSGNFEHYILVDERDRKLFSQLEGPNRHVRTVESILPWWLRRVPGARRWWLSLRTPPVRNWALQQLVKLSVGDHIDADAYVFVDSDVFFVRPFQVEQLERDGLLRLFRVEGAAQFETHFRWQRTATRLLGLPVSNYTGATYIGNLITWRRDVLKQMYRHIEEVSGRPWLEAVAWQWHLSEYILYGVFTEHVIGANSGHFYTNIPLAHISWNYRLENDSDLDFFFSEIWPEHVAVMVSSKQHIPAERYRRFLTRPLAAVKLVPNRTNLEPAL